MPIHEVLGGVLGQLVPALWQRVTTRLGGAPGVLGVAVRLVVPAFRTAGYFQNQLLRGVFGREPTPAERLMAGVTSGWPVPANPFFTAFLSGMAYPNKEEIAEGWLSTFGQILFSPIVETDLVRGIRGAADRDFLTVMDAVSEWVSEDLGLETAAAFFRGISKVTADFQSLTGVAIPVNYLGELLIWLDDVMRGTFDKPFPWPPSDERPWPFERPALGEPGALLNFPASPGWREALGTVWPSMAPAVRRVAVDLVKSAGSSLTTALKLENVVPEDVKEKLKYLLMWGAGAAKAFAAWPPPGGGGKRTRV